jgi:hypothetical protein
MMAITTNSSINVKPRERFARFILNPPVDMELNAGEVIGEDSGENVKCK